MPEKQRATLICLLLALVTLAIYWPATHFDFINYDDPDYVIYNSPIQHGLNRTSLAWAFKTNHASNWHPLTWISHIADVSLSGLDPGRHHLTNILFHTANAVLVFLVLWQLTGAQWRSALVAALFAWHPLHVESVAWISERKDVLSAFFWLLTLSAYGRYAKGSKIQYALALFFFACGLLSKPMIVTLPFVLLLMDFWPLRRRLFLLEKAPFFVLSVIVCAITVHAQQATHSVVSSAVLPLSQRLANALISAALYLGKTVWPVNLALPYPYSHPWNFWQAAAAGILLLGISALAVARRRTQPFLLVGWLWFLGTLAPVIGLVQVGLQFMADRYTYLPLLGIFIMAAWTLPQEWDRWPRPGFVFGAVIAGVLLFLAAGTENQLAYWRNSVTLFSHTVAVTSGNILAEYNLGEALARQGDEAQAITHYERAIAIHPNPVEAQYNSQPQAHYNLGLLFLGEQHWQQAAEQFRACLRHDPRLAGAHENLGAALMKLGQTNEARTELQIARRLNRTN
ncbi:MAG TPA: tetratricopeptide repeat protein [Candidatus Saccharimonadales bacterium]|nr:tetratricopeptide repeat protein [Candidatus Saccharimonadales bacterium]